MPTTPPASSPLDDSPAVKPTRKEQARQLRRAAYQKAKERRANDPRMIAIKEAMKQRQRAAYQAAKVRRKAAVAEQDERRKERELKLRAERDAAMKDLVKPKTG